MYVLWMYISAAFVRKLKPIQVSRNMYTPNGAWDIISRHSRIINKRGQRFTDAGLFLICPHWSIMQHDFGSEDAIFVGEGICPSVFLTDTPYRLEADTVSRSLG